MDELKQELNKQRQANLDLKHKFELQEQEKCHFEQRAEMLSKQNQELKKEMEEQSEKQPGKEIVLTSDKQIVNYHEELIKREGDVIKRIGEDKKYGWVQIGQVLPPQG